MAGKKTGKRLLTWVLVLVMALSLLPLNALAKNVWSTEYGWIRIYLDEATKKDLKALDGLSHQVRIVSTKYPGGMHACAPLSDYWWTENNARKVTANKITSIDLAGDEAIGSSNKISIPIQGNETYEVKVSEGYHKGVTKLDSYSYLRIVISKRTPEPPKAPDAPNYDNLKTLIGDITVNCTNTEASHASKNYTLLPDSYTPGEVEGDAENGYTYTVTINSQKYVEQFDADTSAVHTPKDATATVTLEYKNNAWLVKSGTPISFNVVCETAPDDPELGKNFDFDKNIVDVICETTSDHNYSYGLMNDYYTVDKKTKLSSDRWQCEITINLDKYFALYNSEHTGHTRDKEHKEATSIMRIYPTWYASSGKWIFVGTGTANIYVKCDATPTEPSKEEVKKLLGDNAVQIICTNDKATHTPKSKGYALIEDSYTSDGVKGDAENGYTYTVTIKSEKYVNQFDTDTGAVHTPKNATATVTLEYKNNAWLVKSGTPISFNVVCDAAPTYPVYVYAFFAHDNTQLTGDVTVNGKPIEWNEDANNEEYKEYFVTLGVYRNGTTKVPTDGATGLDLPALNVTEYEAAKITSQGNGTKNDVTLTDITGFPSPSGKVCKGAAGYPEIEDKLSWHLDGQVNVYTVTYDYNDGTTQGAPTSNGYYFGSYTIAAAPQRDGYTFTGWKDGDTTYQADQKIDKLSKDLNLVAQWTARTDLSYTVNYLEKDSNKVLHDQKVQNGMTFKATVNSADEKIDIDGYTYVSADPKTLTIGTGENVINLYYTKRTDLSYTVKYVDKNTGSEIQSSVVRNGKTFGDKVTGASEKVNIANYTYVEAKPDLLIISTDVAKNVITLYYTKNAPTPVTFDFNDVVSGDGKNTPAITKTVKGNVGRNFKETFKVTVEPKSDNANNTMTPDYYTGEAVVTYSDLKDIAFQFAGNDKLTFRDGGKYTYTVRELPSKTSSRMSYDTTEYTLTITVALDKEANAYKVTSWQFTAGNREYPAPLNIINTYRTYHPSTPSKPTLNTGDHYAYVMGYPDGTVRPNGSITRAEVSAILFRLLSDKTRDEYFTTESSFTDVKAGAWYNNSIATLEKAGVIVDTAKGGAFRPNEAITRAELAAMLAQFSDAKPVKGVKFSDVSAEHWAYEAIAIAAKMGWIEGYPDGTFRPDATITRAEMMTLVNRALERVPSDEDHLLSKRVMLTFPDCKSGDWFYIAVQEATNSHTYERAATEKNGDEQWTALRANRDWTLLEK